MFLALASRSALMADASYSYELDADGSPVFTQVIRWNAVEYAQSYRLEIMDANQAVLVDDIAETTERTVHLGSGEYLYRISIFNLLGKCEYSGPWVPLRVLKAERPAILSISPGTIYAGQDGQRLTIVGERLLPASRVSVIDAATGTVACEAVVLEASDGTTLVVELPSGALDIGEYRLSIENPGGLCAESSGSFRVKPARTSRTSQAVTRRDLPFEFSTSAGWTPEIPLSDEWYESLFGGRLNPAGFSIDALCAFTKFLPVAFGVRADASFAVRAFDMMVFDVRYERRLAGVSAFVSYMPMRSLTVLAGLGGAFAWTRVSVENEILGMSEVATVDPVFHAYAEAQYEVLKGAYAGAGVAYKLIAYRDASAGIVAPRLFAGWRF